MKKSIGHVVIGFTLAYNELSMGHTGEIFLKGVFQVYFKPNLKLLDVVRKA